MKKLLLTCTDLMAIQFMIPHVRYLSENGFSVELACSDVGGRMEELRRALEGVAPVHTVRLVRSPFSAANRHGYSDLKRLIDGADWDVIWTNEPVMGVMTRLAARSARRRGAKVVYMVHGFHFYTGAPKKNWLLYYPVERYCSRLCDMIITINNEDCRRAKTFHAKRVEKLDGVGVDLSRFAPDKESRRQWREQLGLAAADIALLTVGELTPRKNQHVMLEALGLLRDERLKLYICGRGELETQLKELVDRLGLNEQVSFLGYRRDIPQICCAADAFVFTSVQEGLPRALLEAMANGKPVICSNIRGNIDLIENAKGGFVVPNDAKSVADALRQLIGDDALREKMGEYNVEAVKKYDIRKIEAELCRLLNL